MIYTFKKGHLYKTKYIAIEEFFVSLQDKIVILEQQSIRVLIYYKHLKDAQIANIIIGSPQKITDLTNEF